jgi:hypothetical protein
MKVLGLKTFALPLLAGTLAMAGCPSDDSPSGSDTDNGSSSTSGTDSASTTSTTTAGMTSASTTDTSTTSTSTTTSGSSGGVVPQPNGADCEVDAECESGHCFFISLLGGVCGECVTEEDCDGGGCTPPNPLVDPPLPATCNDGGLGEGCNTDAVCQDGLTCIEFINVPNVLEISTCGECTSDADCTDGTATECAPQIDVANFTGQQSCVDPGSVPAGGGCDYMANGEECEMGLLCASVDIMSLLTFGLCGECQVDADCTTMGEVCLDPDVNLDTGEVTPPLCGPMP